MAGYKFETPEFGLSEQGLHRLRSRYAFEEIPYAAMRQATVTRGKSVQNWWLLLAFGVLCLGLAIFTAVGIVRFLLSDRPGHLDVREVVIPIIPAFVGVAAIWQAMEITAILVVRTERRRLVFPLNKLKSGQSPEKVASYLATRWEILA